MKPEWNDPYLLHHGSWKIGVLEDDSKRQNATTSNANKSKQRTIKTRDERSYFSRMSAQIFSKFQTRQRLN